MATPASFRTESSRSTTRMVSSSSSDRASLSSLEDISPKESTAGEISFHNESVARQPKKDHPNTSSRLSTNARVEEHENGSDPKIPELGYFLLENELVSFAPAASGTPSSSLTRRISSDQDSCRTWIPVDVIFSAPSTTDDTKQKNKNDTVAETKNEKKKKKGNAICLKMYQNGRPSLDLSDVDPFDGMVKSMTQARRENDKEEDDDQQQSSKGLNYRSDLSCLLGLLKVFPDHVSILSCQVLPLLESNRSKNEQLDDEKPISQIACAVVVTVGFPHVLKEETQRGNNTRVLVPPKGKVFKPLHSGLQLILSTIRSDWEYLKRTMDLMTSSLLVKEKLNKSSHCDNSQFEKARKRKRFFPTRVSLEELYLNMESAGKSEKTLLDWTSHKLLAQSNDCHLVRMLPREILAERVAPFLKAPSLDSLRSTCSFFHGVLSAVVPGLRKLRLYQHQIGSLVWMRDREARLVTESDCMKRCTYSDRIPDCPDGDLHRAASGGQTTLLRTRDGQWSCRLSQWTGVEVEPYEEGFGCVVARGGLLADEPGLGKTITVLSLILQTAGLKTADETSSSEDSSEEKIFHAYWKESFPAEFRRKDLLSLLNGLIKSYRSTQYIPFILIRKAIGTGSYMDFTQFQMDVVNEIEASSLGDSESVKARDVIKARFNEMVDLYKRKQLKAATKSCRARPSSTVVALHEANERQKFLNSLLTSTSSLLVVPKVLLDHWRDQIKLHVDFSYMFDKEPLIFEFNTSSTSKDIEKAQSLIRGTHSPAVFIDRAPSKQLPDANFLAAFSIVITSNNRLMYEWGNGSFQEELRRISDDAGDASCETAFNSINRSGSACPLLKVYWLRLIVDEGHSMGKSQQSASVKFASWIAAERRWAMTGTPTKHHDTTGLGQLKDLLSFLQHDFFCKKNNREALWKRFISKSWKVGDLCGFYHLRSLLRMLMKRHTKLDIELPPPSFIRKLVPMSPIEVETYNALVTTVQMNLVLTSLTKDAKVDSLLNANQRRHATSALGNVRKVCVGYSRVRQTLSKAFYDETILLAQNYLLDDEKITSIGHYLDWTTKKGGLSQCQCCGITLSVLLIGPCCGALFCTDCVSTEVKNSLRIECMICGQMMKVSRLQRFQPGFIPQWEENLEEVARTRPKSPTASPASSTLLTDSSTSVESPVVNNEIVVRPPQERRRTRKPNDGHTCQYDSFSIDGKCILCFAEHETCNLIATGRCQVCHRTSLDCPREESKAFYLVERLLELYNDSQTNTLHHQRPLKVIVYSQYRNALNLVGTHLIWKYGRGCVSEYWGRYRTTEMAKFVHNKECFVMLLSKDGSEGLDLSFVTHIFFLEEVWDRSQAEQAVARAWRMGASGRVQVETLIAEDSVEETMAEYERAAHGDEINYTTTEQSKEYREAKTHALLKSLRYITEFQSTMLAKTSSAMEASPSQSPETNNGNLASRLKRVNDAWKQHHNDCEEKMKKDTTMERPRKRQRRVEFTM